MFDKIMLVTWYVDVLTCFAKNDYAILTFQIIIDIKSIFLKRLYNHSLSLMVSLEL